MASSTGARLQNKVAIVTGSSSGLGRSIALLFASHGASLIICADLRPEPSGAIGQGQTPTHDEICKKYGEDNARFLKCDVGNSDDVKSAVKLAVQHGQRLDIIVNNAGIGNTNPKIRLHEQDDDEWDRIMRINSRGVYLGCKHAIAQFLQQEPLLGTSVRGWIVNVASIFGLAGFVGGLGPYCASKGAVANLTRQVAVDYAKEKIVCNALCPGFTVTAQSYRNFQDPETNARMTAATPWGEWGQPDDVAKGALYLASDDSTFVTGHCLPVDGGYMAT